MQLLADELAGLRMQVLDGENVPELLLVNETVPVGAVGDDVVSVDGLGPATTITLLPNPDT